MCHIPGLSHSSRLITVTLFYLFIYFCGSTATLGPRPPHYRGFEITLIHNTHGRATLDDGKARRRETFTWQHATFARDWHPRTRRDSNSQSQQVRERPQTHALTIADDSKITKLLTMQFFPALCYFHILPLTWETKFHVHTKQQANSQFCTLYYFTSLNIKGEDKIFRIEC